jgi:GTP pyrophosphokinase
MVKTSRARAKIRQWLRKEEKERALELGREVCERALKVHDTSLKKLIKNGQLRELLTKLKAASLDDMLTKVGEGTVTLQQIERALLPDEVVRHEEEKRYEAELLEKTTGSSQSKPIPAGGRGVVQIDGIDDLLIKISQCCRPVPGDAIIGYITMGSGVAVHKAQCHNLLSAEPERLLEVRWSGSTTQGPHRTELFLRAEDRRNLLADISATISSDDANIIEMNSRTGSDHIAEFRVMVEINDLQHLQLLQTHLRQLPNMLEVRRR